MTERSPLFYVSAGLGAGVLVCGCGLAFVAGLSLTARVGGLDNANYGPMVEEARAMDGGDTGAPGAHRSSPKSRRAAPSPASYAPTGAAEGGGLEAVFDDAEGFGSVSDVEIGEAAQSAPEAPAAGATLRSWFSDERHFFSQS